MLDTMSMHMATSQTQLDIREELESIIIAELRQLLGTDLPQAAFSAIDFCGKPEVIESELKFNSLVISLHKQVLGFLEYQAALKGQVDELLVKKVISKQYLQSFKADCLADITSCEGLKRHAEALSYRLQITFGQS